MEFTEYQIEAKHTAKYPDQFVAIYPTLGLANEAGEVAGKVKKLLRDEAWTPEQPLTPEQRADLVSELGDVLWYLSQTASDFGITLNEIADENLTKLYSRLARGVIGGSGDHR